MNSVSLTKGTVSSDAPSAYILHAREINAVARATLRVDTRDATFVARKISIGLSLQSVELAGKGILRSMGQSVAQIRSRHRNHDLLALLQDAEAQVNARPEEAFQTFRDFLSWRPVVEGRQYRTTIGEYFIQHFSRGASSLPRSYFYPDIATFTGPRPIQTILVIADFLIDIADGVVSTRIT